MIMQHEWAKAVVSGAAPADDSPSSFARMVIITQVQSAIMCVHNAVQTFTTQVSDSLFGVWSLTYPACDLFSHHLFCMSVISATALVYTILKIPRCFGTCTNTMPLSPVTRWNKTALLCTLLPVADMERIQASCSVFQPWTLFYLLLIHQHPWISNPWEHFR